MSKRELSKERQEILRVLREAAEPLTPSQVSAATDKHPNAVRKLMFAMLSDAQLVAGPGLSRADW